MARNPYLSSFDPQAAEDEILGIDPLELDMTEEPDLAPAGFLERFATGAQGFQAPAPTGFLAGLVGGFGQGLASRGQQMAAARQKAELGMEQRRMMRERANIAATAKLREERSKARGEVFKEQRGSAQRQAEYERDNPIITPEMIAAAPAGSPLRRLQPGQRVARSALDTALLREPPQPREEQIVPVQMPDGSVKYVPRSQAIGMSPPAPKEPAKAKPSAAEREALVGDLGILDQISTLRSQFGPGLSGPVSGLLGSVAQRTGIRIGRPKDEAKFRATLAGIRNQILKLRSGGAVSDGEAARLLQELPTEGDPTEVFLAKLDQFENVSRHIATQRREILGGTGVDLSGIPDLPRSTDDRATVVQTPDGQTFTFPDAKSAAAFRKKAGL